MEPFIPRNRIFPLIRWGIGFSLVSLLVACGGENRPEAPATLNSRYRDEQPAISGDGRLLAFVSDRNGSNQIALYDLQRKRLVELPGLNKENTIAQSPSLSLTGRYLVYLVSQQGRPTISLYDRATQSSEILTKNYRNWVRNPKISPDGRYIVFETARRGQWDVEVLDRGTEIELDVPEGEVIEGPEQ